MRCGTSELIHSYAIRRSYNKVQLMCGIFGQVLAPDTAVSWRDCQKLFRQLFLLSETRGKEAAGVATLNRNHINILKSGVRASRMVRTRQYQELVQRVATEADWTSRRSQGSPIAFIGHSRLVTTGSHARSENNQPVVSDGCVGVHNGIVVNQAKLWAKHSDLRRRSQLDSEVIFSLLHKYSEETSSIEFAIQQTFNEIEGVASIAAIFDDLDVLVLATNNGSLYYCSNDELGAIFFASERYILKRLLSTRCLRDSMEGATIRHLMPSHAAVVSLTEFALHEFPLKSSERNSQLTRLGSHRRIIVQSLANSRTDRREQTHALANVGLATAVCSQSDSTLESAMRRFHHDSFWSDSLRRCTRCILPETMPYIAFDETGICNYCTHYQPLTFAGEDCLDDLLSHQRKENGTPNCVVGVSGGRDSVYSLHYIKTVMKMSPVAYTYDWGMVTDLARRNISRVCGKLGIEHIIVSADIEKKRRFVRTNVAAWLRRPCLGMIPLFMAGDKQYFYHLTKVRKQFGIDLGLLGENRLERTDFKTGFAGVAPFADERHVYTLPLLSKLKLLAYYGRQHFANPSYINRSMWDSAFALVCYYASDRSYINLFNYVVWDEEKVVGTIMDEYGFELSPDTTSTWRIGDGTSAFYNYIYYHVAGFTENDTFRSNQIREGVLDRDEALSRVREENKPRFETIRWYLETIQLNRSMDDVLETIHNIPRLSPPQ